MDKFWWGVILGGSVGFLVFSTLGREMMMTGMGMGKAEIKRALKKVQKYSEERETLLEV